MSRAWSLRSLLLLGFAIAGVGLTPPASASPGVSVTENWGELFGQPPLQVEDRTWVRLGVETKKGPPGSPVLVYAVLEGPVLRDLSRSDSIPTTTELGPLRIVPIPRLESLAKKQEVLKELERLRRYPSEALRVLYAASIRVPQRGKLRYQIRRGAEVLASFELQATGARAAPWFVLKLPEETGKTEALGLGKDASPVRLRVSRDLGIPRWPGEEALLWETPRRFLPFARALPRAIPTTPELGLEISPTGEVTLSLKRGLGPLAGHVLARFWINRKPVLQRHQAKQRQNRAGLLRKLERRVSLRLELDLETIGASGEQIEVQLLYSPEGWDPDHHGHERERLRALSAGGQPAISRRVVLHKAQFKAILKRMNSWKGLDRHPCVRLLPD